jgi:hypothetical protein
MLHALTQPEQQGSRAQAWLVAFQEQSDATHSDMIVVAEPRNVAALLSPSDIADVLSDAAATNSEALTIIWMPLEAGGQGNSELESWVRAGGASSKSAPVRASVRTARAIWRDGRALVYANSELLHDALDALVRFTIAERETTRLEQAMRSAWAPICADAELTHAFMPGDQKRQQHVNNMTEAATRMKTANLRLNAALAQVDPALSEPSKRLFSELILAANLYDRLENLEEPIQFALDHYEVVNTRLIDARHAAKEMSNFTLGHILETMIVLLLIGELLVSLYGIRLFR